MVANYYSPDTVSKAINLEFVIPLIFQNWDRFSEEYQLQRILIGLCKVIECQQVTDKNLTEEMMKRILSLV